MNAHTNRRLRHELALLRLSHDEMEHRYVVALAEIAKQALVLSAMKRERDLYRERWAAFLEVERHKSNELATPLEAWKGYADL